MNSGYNTNNRDIDGEGGKRGRRLDRNPEVTGRVIDCVPSMSYLPLTLPQVTSFR